MRYMLPITYIVPLKFQRLLDRDFSREASLEYKFNGENEYQENESPSVIATLVHFLEFRRQLNQEWESPSKHQKDHTYSIYTYLDYRISWS
ncbi:uncharacterized protein G2W53_039366 [Senna tora]|uniref:Uncharacterized protein n=1 Tax=Senna tora TaxID=362788 RepID=A0A834SMD7_9FABA|nr:uncharacterized protein G2W53_039366 [Senna tora]